MAFLQYGAWGHPTGLIRVSCAGLYNMVWETSLPFLNDNKRGRKFLCISTLILLSKIDIDQFKSFVLIQILHTYIHYLWLRGALNFPSRIKFGFEMVTSPEFFFLNFMMEPGWQASLGRIRITGNIMPTNS